MNYFPFHIGDYAADTAHLEPMEDLAYRRMLDLYYRTEKPLPSDWREVARLIRLRDFPEAIESVLAEFFELTEEGWQHARCDAEIKKMQDKQAKARTSAQASVNARQANAQRTLNERSADAELPTPTPTPTPVVNPPTPRKRGKPAEPAGFDEFWTAYPRKVAKGAALKAWAKVAPGEGLRLQILSAVGRAKEGADWRKDGGAFIPHPATWLNAQRWLDEPVRIASVAPSVEVWKPPPPMTPEERAASDEARRRAMTALKRIA